MKLLTKLPYGVTRPLHDQRRACSAEAKNDIQTDGVLIMRAALWDR